MDEHEFRNRESLLDSVELVVSDSSYKGWSDREDANSHYML